jgi:hypothetical protein
MTTLRRIFYIYNDASIATLLLIGALVELACAAALPGFLSTCALVFAAILAAMGASLAACIYRRAKQSNII